MTRPPAVTRVAGLDGVRGIAALYVLLFHCWLYTFLGFPDNRGPWWLGWLVHGRLAVVLFLVVSGFSLALAVADDGWRLGSLSRFLRRRAWRILPPYWAALALSLAVAWTLSPARGPDPTARTVVVHGALLQDLVPERTPNAAFWSIAVEAELYLLFPLFVLVRRRLGAVALLAAVTLPVVVAAPADGAHGLTPHLAPAFAAGIVAAGVVTARDRVKRLPWPWLAAAAASPVLLTIAVRGPVWTVEHYFWVDLAIAPAMAALLVALATGRPPRLVRLLETRALRGLGRFSYSLYLVHVPIVMVVARQVALRYVDRGLPAFLFTIAAGVPLAVGAAWIFAKVFELPFQRHRSWRELRTALTPPAPTAPAPARRSPVPPT